MHIIYIGSTLPYNEQSHFPHTPIITRSRVVGPLKAVTTVLRLIILIGQGKKKSILLQKKPFV